MPTLPNEPYPGLRPFLDHEAPLLMGRGDQITQIIERLESTRFVAVVGGSGCGKSSVIRAGVVPKLRGFGIPSEGDYWIPVVYTPGTTRLAEKSVAGQRRDGDESPVTRLAWKLAQVLKPAKTGELDASRRREISTVFRQGAGFARLVDGYCDELQALGPSGADARFVFVIDQFEELFHPNNHGSEDAQATIEAVISHFYNPHDRCFVVLTMRSEHLADCATYLELPDAINKSLYLVRRLDEMEIREAIVGPAKYYLRLKQRADEPLVQLPPDVTFEENVIGRVLRDVSLIANDADHLPLLQHLLARTWYAACSREARPSGGVPSEVRWEDLERAVDPTSPQPHGWLRPDSHVNALRSCLENWAEHTYGQRSPSERAQIDALLRKLAFRDPNSGLYFQQRVDVDEASLQLGVPREHLQALLQHGFIDTVNYLYWDKENPERVTLKVSHEAFIRGWERFRTLIDREAERFDEFVNLLRKCALWKSQGSDRFLLESSELARIEAAKLEEVFRIKDERRSWFQHLLEYRDGEQLSHGEPNLDTFLAKSRRKANWGQMAKASFFPAIATWAAIALAVAAYFLFARPANSILMQFTDARNVVAARGDTIQNQLKALIGAARKVQDIEHGWSFWWVDRSGRALSFIKPLSDNRELSQTSSPEPSINGNLRELMTRTVWSAAASDAKPLTATMRANYTCRLGDATAGKRIDGMLAIAADDPSRALFVSEAGVKEYPELRFHAALVSASECTIGEPFSTVQKDAQPAVVVDAQLTYLAVARNEFGQDTVNVFVVQWERNLSRLPRLKPLAPIFDPTAAEYVRKEVRGTGADIKAVATSPARAGVIVTVGDRQWRLFADTAVPGAKSNDEWSEIQPPQAGSVCGKLGFRPPERPKDPSQPAIDTAMPKMFEHESTCFMLSQQSQGPPDPEAVSSGPSDPIWVLNAFTAFQAETLGQPGVSKGPVQPLASLPIGVFDDIKSVWMGRPNTQWDGWIGIEQSDKDGRFLVAPWATSALAQLGCEVLPTQTEKGTRILTDEDKKRLCPNTDRK